jgi:hypothetical protein
LLRFWRGRRAPAGWLPALLAGELAWLAILPVLWAVFANPDRGLDAMDESHYLMAAQPWASDKAFNGVFGWYTGPLLRLAGGSLAWFRTLASALLVAAALVLASWLRHGVERLTGRAWPLPARFAWPPAVVAAALCYDTVYVRTPSYNWCAAIGLMLLAAGLVGVVADAGTTAADRTWRLPVAGALVAAGAFATATGKATTALAAAAVTLGVALLLALFGGTALRRDLGRAVIGALAAGSLLLAAHLLLVHDLAFTVATYQRVTRMMALVDPYHYAGAAVPETVVAGLHDVVLDRPWPFLPLLLPILATAAVPLFRVRRFGRWLALAALPAIVVPAVVVLHDYPGGVPGLGMSAPPLVVAAAAGCLVALAAALWRAPRAGSALVLSVALFAIGVAYPIGTNVEYATQLHGGFVVLLAAAVIGVSALPRRPAVALVAVLAVLGVGLGDVLVPRTRIEAPYRISPLPLQVLPRSIVPGTAPVLVEPAMAAWIDGLRALAAQGGWRAGSPMLDLTWHPASVLVLDGRAPAELLPDFPGWPDPGSSAAFAVSQEDPALWRRAWLLVPEGQDDAVADAATSVVGLRFPADYAKVGTVVAPYDGQLQGLWRPSRTTG